MTVQIESDTSGRDNKKNNHMSKKKLEIARPFEIVKIWCERHQFAFIMCA